jgi:MFS family permease
MKNRMNDKLDEFRGEDDGTGRPEYSGGILSFSLKKTFASFGNPVFRLYYLAMVGHWSSLNMQMLARNLLVYRITGSGAILGVLALATAIPMILFALPGGVIADRIQKRTVIQLGQVVSSIVSLTITLVLFFGYLSPEHPESWWILVVSGALQGAVMGFMMPSRQAIVSEIVGPEQLMNAISLNNLGMNTFRILSPALAGFMVDLVDFWAVYAIMTAMYVMSWVVIIFVPPTSSPKIGGTNYLVEMIEGWKYVRRERTIFLILMFTVAATILGMPYSQLLPMFTEDILKVSATGMGVLVTVSGAGAIVGSLILTSLTNRKRGLILLLAGLLLSATLIGFSFSEWWYLSLILIIFVGLGSTVQMTLGNSLIQYYSDATYRGRVMSFFMLGFGFSSLGAFFAGILAEGIGAPLSVGGLAVVLLIITMVLLTWSPRLRRLD